MPDDKSQTEGWIDVIRNTPPMPGTTKGTEPMTDEMRRGYCWLSKAWYGDASLRGSGFTDEMMIKLYAEDGGAAGEFCIQWHTLGGNSCAKLGVFSEGWRVLWVQCGDLLQALAELDGQHPTPEDIADVLNRLGYANLTPTEDPVRAAETPPPSLVEVAMLVVDTLPPKQATALRLAIARESEGKSNEDTENAG